MQYRCLWHLSQERLLRGLFKAFRDIIRLDAVNRSLIDTMGKCKEKPVIPFWGWTPCLFPSKTWSGLTQLSRKNMCFTKYVTLTEKRRPAGHEAYHGEGFLWFFLVIEWKLFWRSILVFKCIFFQFLSNIFSVLFFKYLSRKLKLLWKLKSRKKTKTSK